MIYGFDERLAFSKGAKQKSDIQTIMSLFAGCVAVAESTPDLDKIGVDYIATLRGGAEVFIDVKTRSKGCSRYWSGSPEVAIELWSVMPGGKYKTASGKAGWTVDESKVTDLVLYTFDEEDCTTAYLFPYQHLRIAARGMITQWIAQYKVDIQDSGGWESQAVFVPVDKVIESIQFKYDLTP